MAQIEVYYASPDSIDAVRNEAILAEDEARHLLRVRRARPGDEVMVIDGRGMAWSASLKEARRDRAVLVLDKQYEKWNESPVYVTLGLGLLKADHFLDAVNLAVQAGASQIDPLECRYSIGGFSENRHQRAERVSITAAKQCGRGLIPPVSSPQQLEDWCIQRSDDELKIVLDDVGEAIGSIDVIRNVVLAVGPEGGFHPDEIEMMESNGFLRASLGQRRLRSETAAVLAVASIVLPLEGR